MVLYICGHFIKISLTVYNLQQTRVHGRNGYVQCSKSNNSKGRQSELRFMCSACPLIVLYICVKFPENILNSFQLTVQTWVHGRNGYIQCSKGNNSTSRQYAILSEILVYEILGHLPRHKILPVGVDLMTMSSHLHLCEVWWKYL